MALEIIADNNFMNCHAFDILRPRQNGRHFADNILKCVFLKENIWMLLKISLKFVPEVRINNIPVLVKIMAWCRPGDKPLSEPMMVRLPTHICVTRPKWVNDYLWINCELSPFLHFVIYDKFISGHTHRRMSAMASLRSGHVCTLSPSKLSLSGPVKPIPD